MFAYILIIIVGILLIGIGISNLHGNIISIHEYHRNRVSDDNKPIFGKLMGIGTIIISLTIMSFGILSLVSELTENPAYITTGSYLVIVGLAIGIGFFIYTTVKYNKGIF